MSGEDILALVIAVTLVIIILVVISILLYKRCQYLHIENSLDELSWSAQQAMINEALRASRNNN